MDIDLFDPESWCGLSFAVHRDTLAAAITDEIGDAPGLEEVWIEAGPRGREYDLTAVAETDVGRLRTPLWSHARAVLFCDSSVHPANRARFAPGFAARESAARLRGRLTVPFSLETRGLTVTLTPEEGTERVWTAERSLFRNRTAVTREDRVANAASDIDVRDLFAHFYTGPSLRLVNDEGEAFLVPAATEAEGPLISLCHGCRSWAEGSHESCPHCGAVTEIIVAARPASR